MIPGPAQRGQVAMEDRPRCQALWLVLLLAALILVPIKSSALRGTSSEAPTCDQDNESSPLEIVFPLSGLISLSSLADNGVCIRIGCLPDGEYHVYLSIGRYKAYRSFSRSALMGESELLEFPLKYETLVHHQGPGLPPISLVGDGIHDLVVSLFGEAMEADEENRIALSARTVLDVRVQLDLDVLDICPLCRFTTGWTHSNTQAWEALLLPWARLLPSFSLSVLEVGSWEGQSALWFAKRLAPQRVTCVDTWKGGQDHRTPLHESLLLDLEARFDHNLIAAQLPRQTLVEKRKGSSTAVLAALITEQRQYDVVYIDGAHTSMAVLTDTVMALHMLTVGGYMLFDDWDWNWSSKTGNRSHVQGGFGADTRVEVDEAHAFVLRLTTGVLERVYPCAANQACFRKTAGLDSDLQPARASSVPSE